jgi:hypothetical protein
MDVADINGDGTDEILLAKIFNSVSYDYPGKLIDWSVAVFNIYTGDIRCISPDKNLKVSQIVATDLD